VLEQRPQQRVAHAGLARHHVLHMARRDLDRERQHDEGGNLPLAHERHDELPVELDEFRRVLRILRRRGGLAKLGVGRFGLGAQARILFGAMRVETGRRRGRGFEIPSCAGPADEAGQSERERQEQFHDRSPQNGMMVSSTC